MVVMSAIKQPFKARVLESGDRTVLLVDDSSSAVYLRFAFLERESESELFPESLLDDWGHEIASFELYEWVQENGSQFPRAEIFGFDRDGMPQQCFLRQLDLASRYPCYLYKDAGLPLAGGQLVEAVLIVDPHVRQVQRSKAPDHIGGPLCRARLSWWRIPSDCDDSFDFSLLIQP